jgi:hypothetical protein
MNKFKLSLISLSILFSFSNNAWADETKSQYHLFNPTPKDKMRGLITDRPDKTESPYTVDAGHFQLETDLVTFMRDQEKEDVSELTMYNFINLKAGLTNNIDLQVLIPSYNTIP